MNSAIHIKLNDAKVESTNSLPAVLIIAGSDSSGGAGIEADLKTLTANKVYGLTCITALTAQNTSGVSSIHPVPKQMIKDILNKDLQDFLYGYKNPPLKAVKLGMLTDSAVEALGEYIQHFLSHDISIILDPVMVSTSGSQLFSEKGMKLCVETILRYAFLITPNFLEACVLLGLVDEGNYTIEDVKTIDDYIGIGIKLHERIGCTNVLVKGGHIPWNSKTNTPFRDGDNIEDKEIIDILVGSSNITLFHSKAIDSSDTHGTGCTLASCISANIAKSHSLTDSVGLAIDYIHRGIVNMTRKLGHGNGPINHLVSPAIRIETIINSENVSHKILDQHTSFLDYFKSHPDIKPNWEAYTHHKFIKLLAQNQLPFNQFLYFLKQDYYYLINYAQVHGLSASVAPSYRQIHTESVIIGEIIQEIEKHKEKLSKQYGVVYDGTLKPGRACLNYCNYLLKIGKSEDFLGIKVALSPCLHGYYEAAKNGSEIRGLQQESDEQEQLKVYDSWLQDYTSDWYVEACSRGIDSLQDILKSSMISESRLKELTQIFNQVTILEVEFWNEVLNI